MRLILIKMNSPSPLAWSAATRLALACVLVGLLWLATFWALDWLTLASLDAVLAGGSA